MAKAADNGFGWQHHHQKEEEEEGEGEEDELEGDVAPNGSPGVGESRLVGHMDRWDISSSSQEIPQELQDYQDLLGENGEDYDFSELHELEGLGEANVGSPPADYLEGEEIPEDLSPLSYWRPKTDHRLGFPEDNQERDGFEGQENPSGAWDAASEGGAYPELSYEDQYGSEFSTSPEALRDPLALYQRRESYSSISDGREEELSENSNLSPSPSGPLPEGTRLKIDVFETRGLRDESWGFPRETELSSLSERSHTLSSPEGSVPWSGSPLGHQFREHLQNSSSIAAETFPDPSWMENRGQLVETGLPMGAGRMVPSEQHNPLTMAQPEEGLLDLSEGIETPPARRQASYRLPEKAWNPKAGVPRGLPSKFSRQSRSLSPQGRASRRKAGGSDARHPDRGSQPTLGASDALPYGRGQLNYPLPDLSKVEPRVRFPKDSQSYHPPQGKTLPARSKDPGKPVIFKSPAEIVCEVLLSSEEGSPRKLAAPTVSVIPEELKSPQQATELMHQLQEDYHKLLTKYAEAENTIDRLRLGAKVRLYADPPKPSQGVEMGTVSRASKVMTFSIPQVRAAEVTTRPGPATQPVESKAGFSGQRVVSSSLLSSGDTGIPRADGSTSSGKAFTGDELTQLLASQAKKFRTQVESLEELIRTGRLAPQDQLKGFARLKEAQGALQQAYLQGRDEHQLLQKQRGPAGALGDFDPDRVVEGEIFHLEIRLQELKERLEQALSNQPLAQNNPEATVAPSSHFPVQSPEPQMVSPTPSLQAPVPAVRTPYPEASNRESSHYRAEVDWEGSSVSNETTEEGEGLPEPLRHRQLQVEEEFDHLLGHYSSFKSLPEAMSSEHLHSEEHEFSPEETDGATVTKNPGTNGDSLQKVPKDKGAARIPSSSSAKEAQQRKPACLLPRKPQRPPYPVPSAQVEKLETQEGSVEQSGTSGAVCKVSSRGRQQLLSPQGSMASVADSAVSERVPKPFRKTHAAFSEELRIVSPETDSGFLGSEASRVSPLARIPKQRSSHSRSHGLLGESAPSDGAHQPAPQRKGPIAMEPPGTDLPPRDRPSEGCPQRRKAVPLSKRAPVRVRSPRQWTHSVTSEMEPGTESSHTNSEAESPGGHGAPSPRPDEPRRSCSPSSSTTSLSPSRTCCYSLLDSRLERDQAIAALQNEISQLRQSLDETLHGPHGYTKRSSSPPRASKLQMPLQGTARFSTSANPMRKTSGKSTVESEGLPPATTSGARMRRSLLPQSGTHEDLSPLEPDCSTPKPQKGRKEEVCTSKMKTPKQPVLQGPYTGTPYAFPTQEPQIAKGASPSLHCQEAKPHPGEVFTSDPGTNETEGCDSQRGSFGTSRTTTPKTTEVPTCLFCEETGTHKTNAGHGKKHAREDRQARNSGAQQKLRNHHQSQRPGLWYTAIPPQVPTIGYIPTVPLAPCPPSSIIYCSPLMTTSTPPAVLPVYDHSKFQATELKTWASWQRPRADPHCSPVLDRDDSFRDLNWSLSRAVEVAKDMKLTTRRMSRSLTWELNKARNLRGSCLF